MKTFVTLSVLLVALLPSAFAQTEVEGFVGYYNPGVSVLQGDFDNGFAVGGRLGHSFLGVLGTEFSYTAVTGFTAQLGDLQGTFDETIHLLNGNFVVQLPIGGFVPFATAGIGGVVGQEGTNFEIRSAWTWNVGGGLKLRRIAGPVGLRFDVRYYNIPDGVEILPLPPDLNRVNFNLVEVSGGLLLTF